MAYSIGVLVTNYNSWDLALKCVNANLRLCGASLDRLLLLDDCSPVPPPAINTDGFQLIRNETNLGFARTLNKGVALLGTDLVVIFDADAYPLNDYLQTVLEEFQADPKLALLGFRTVDENNQPTPSFNREPNAFSLLLGQKAYARCQRYLERKETRICPWMCALVIRRTAFEELGRFDEQFDWLDLDLEFGMRANRSEWNVKVNKSLVAFHKGGGTPTLVADRVLKFYKSRWILLRKHGKIRHPRISKNVILFRLRLEQFLLDAVGRVLFKESAVRRDKKNGRRKLIEYCRHHYQ